MAVISSSPPASLMTTPETILSLIPETSFPTTLVDKVAKTEPSADVFNYIYSYLDAEQFFIEVRHVSNDWTWTINVIPVLLLESGSSILFENDDILSLEG